MIWDDMNPYKEELAQLASTATLGAFIKDVDVKPTAWQNRSAHQQARGPQGEIVREICTAVLRRRALLSSNAIPSRRATSPRLPLWHRPKVPNGKENGR